SRACSGRGRRAGPERQRLHQGCLMLPGRRYLLASLGKRETVYLTRDRLWELLTDQVNQFRLTSASQAPPVESVTVQQLFIEPTTLAQLVGSGKGLYVGDEHHRMVKINDLSAADWRTLTLDVRRLSTPRHWASQTLESPTGPVHYRV